MRSFALAIRTALPLFATLSGAATPALAQKTIRFQDEVCDYTARFDPAVWPEARVRSALRLVYSASETSAPFSPYARTPADAAKIDPDAYARQCQAALDRLDQIDTLGLPELDALKAKTRSGNAEVCLVEGLKLRAQRGEPAALRQFGPAAAACGRFIDALEGRTDLRQTWQAAVTAQCRQNASPAQCRQRAEAEVQGPDAEAQMRFYVLGFGWNNCAINHLQINDGKADALRKAAQNRLKRALAIRALPCQP